MAELITLPALLKAASIGISAFGTIAGGIQAKNSADYQAAQMRRQAQEERAASQREQMQIDRRMAQAQSRMQALSASSGLGPTDPTVMQLSGDVEGEGAYQRGMVGYTGETRARGLEAGAAATAMQGRAARTASLIGAGSTIIGGAASLYEKYAPRRPEAATGGYRYG